jgi:hypothetical protein
MTRSRPSPRNYAFWLFLIAELQQAPFFAGLAMQRIYLLGQVRLIKRFGQSRLGGVR